MLKRSGFERLKILKKRANKKKPQKRHLARGAHRSVPQPKLSGPMPASRRSRPEPETAQTVDAARRRTRRRRKTLSGSLRSIAASVFGYRQKNTAAATHAQSQRRSSRRINRRKLILVCGGTGLVLAAALLIAFVRTPGVAPADAAPAPAQTQGDTAALTAGQTDLGITPLGAKMFYHMPFTAAFDNDGYDDDIDFDFYDFVETTDPDEPDVDDPEPTATPKPKATTKPEPTATPKPTPKPVSLKVSDYLDYFVVEADSYFDRAGYSSNRYEYTHEEYLMLARIIHGEARGQSFKGQVAVGNVIMNRVFCKAFSNNILGVVSAPRQFTVYNKVKDMSESQINSTSRRAARAVLDRELWVVPQDAYFFKGGSEGVDWGSRKFSVKIGGHCFYTYRYGGRSSGLGVPPGLFERTYKHAQYGCKPERRVHRIQFMLNKLGYSVKADSYFGLTTKDALIEFQKKHKLKADGIAGPATVKKLIQEFGAENYHKRFIKKK